MYKDADDQKSNDANKVGQTVAPLYADPIFITVEENPASEVVKMIDDLKGCITKEAVDKVTVEYNKLTDDQKQLVTNYDDLKAAQDLVKAGIPFTDVATGSWYKDAVEFAYFNGLINGLSATTFGPDATTTRAQLVTILYRYADSPKVNGTTPFTDLDAQSGSWYMDAVNWAYQNKIVNGTSASTFSPDAKVTREQLVTILYRYCKDYLGISERQARTLFANYSLAQKVYGSTGTSFVERYNSFSSTLDYDINESVWDAIELAQIENLTDTPGFSEVYRQYFGVSKEKTEE
jgi:hypothetical protein